MIVIAFSENRCIISDQIQFIYAEFSHFCTCTTIDIVPTQQVFRRYQSVSAFSSSRSVPTTGRFHSAQWEDYPNNRADNPYTSSSKSNPCNPEILFYRMWVDLCNSTRINGTHIDRNKPIPKSKKVISQQIDGFLPRFFCNRHFFLKCQGQSAFLDISIRLSSPRRLSS